MMSMTSIDHENQLWSPTPFIKFFVVADSRGVGYSRMMIRKPKVELE
jgi:hypothetical protein